MYPLGAAPKCDFEGFLEAYWGEGVSDEMRRDDFLFSAAIRNRDWEARRAIFSFLVQQGLTVSRVDSEGGNWLHGLAGRMGPEHPQDLELYRMLLEWGCDPNQVSRRFGSPFDVLNELTACPDSMLMPFVECLVDHGFDVCQPGAFGRTPVEAVQSLVDFSVEYGEEDSLRDDMLAYLKRLTAERCG